MSVPAMGWAMTLVALVAAMGGPASAQPRSLPPPPPEIAVLTLPTGPLQMEAGSDTTITFLDKTRTSKAGDAATVWALQVFDPGVRTEAGLAVKIVQRRTIDCRARTQTDTGSVAYDEAGKMVMWLPAYDAEPIAPNSPGAAEALVLCDGAALPTQVVVGHEAALAAGRGVLKGRR